MSSYAGHTREHVCIIYERQKANSLENITWFELGKLNIQAEKVYLPVLANGRSLRSFNPFFYGKQLALFIQGKWRSQTMISRGLTPVLTGRILKMRCRTGRCGIRLVRGSRPKGANDDDAVQLVLLILIRNNAQFTTSIVVSCSAMLVFFGWRSCLVTNFSLLLFRAFLKTYKKDWMSTWRRNACFSRGIVSCYIFFQNTLILVFSRSLPWFFLHCFYTFLVYPCIATLGAFICHPTEFWIIEPLVFQIFLVFCAYWVDDIWLFLCAHANVMELNHSAESALSFYLAGSRRKILNTVKILPRCVQ